MRILGQIVHALVRAMFDAGHDIALRRIVGSKLIGDYHTRRTHVCFGDSQVVLGVSPSAYE
ncbi:hypothetical protein BJF95_04700 [Rhizobium oryziradicis]|uniref:Uncharacterized protein n=1 Tax=Rhizobium oryziradicis TaxID=1867956 RepID=A0A1Q8ZS32_9HYPH|nr:hypothetical protein BJF95_04700 [Rhizobium oryziradicis]